MRNQGRRRLLPDRPSRSEGEPEREEEAFDLWLRGSLQAAFDQVTAEPIPEDLLRMIEEDRAERERLRRKRQGLPEEE